MAASFSFANKQSLDLDRVFEVLHTNMSAIAPTGNTYEEDFAIWREHIRPALEEDGRQMVLMFWEEEFAGYFQYAVHGEIWEMEEIQIQPEYQGTGLFKQMYRWLRGRLPEGIVYVEAYSHKANRKSQGILERLGLVRTGENPKGSSYRYQGEAQTLWERLG